MDKRKICQSELSGESLNSNSEKMSSVYHILVETKNNKWFSFFYRRILSYFSYKFKIQDPIIHFHDIVHKNLFQSVLWVLNLSRYTYYFKEENKKCSMTSILFPMVLI